MNLSYLLDLFTNVENNIKKANWYSTKQQIKLYILDFFTQS